MRVNAKSCPWLIGVDMMGSGTKPVSDLQFLRYKHRHVGAGVTPLPINFAEE